MALHVSNSQNLDIESRYDKILDVTNINIW